MIIELAWKYFVQNRKRTLRSVQIVSLGLIVIFSTALLIGSLTGELSTLSETLNQNDVVLIVEPVEDTFADETIDDLKELVISTNFVNYYNFEYITTSNISTNEIENIWVPVIFTNISKIINRFTFIPDSNYLNKFVITSNLADAFNIRVDDFVSVSNPLGNLTSEVITIIDETTRTINTAIYLDFSVFDIQLNFANRLLIEITEEQFGDEMISQLDRLPGIRTKFVRAEGRFLESSTQDLASTLLVLQVAISLLIVISITNIMSLMIKESRFDIRTLISIGYRKINVWSLFLLISLFIGIFSFILSLILSLLVITLVLTAFSGLIGIQLIQVNIDTISVFSILINSLLISFFSMLFPSYRGIYLK